MPHSPRPALLVVLCAATASLVLLLGVALPAAAQSFPTDSAVLSIIRQRVEEGRSKGIVVGLIDADGRTRIVAYGDPGPGKLPLDGNSVFEIGSITKVFTGTLLAQMVLAGEVALDDPVQKYLPAGVTLPTRNGKEITLASLAEQNSALPRLPANMAPKDMANPYADYTVQQMYDFLSGHTLRRDPGEQFEYSNLGVGLLGHLLALRSGKSYEEAQRERIWTPLGMTRTAITLTPWMTEHLALGHDAEGKAVSNWDLPTLAGAGAIRSTTTDMLKFLAANLRTDRGPLGKAMALAHEPRAPAGNATNRIGLNWIHRITGADTITWHNGGTGGYRAFAGFVASKRMGVVVLTNSGGAGADDIGFHLLVPRLPLAPRPTPPTVRTAITLGAEVLARYVGEYQLAPEFAITITMVDGSLFLQATGQGRLQLWPEAEARFFLKEVDAQVTFVKDAEGVVTSLVLHQNGQDVPGRKVK